MTDDDETDVRCLPYMPLHIERLRRSKAWLRCKRRPELAFYLMNLWMRAWHELPAGSIEDDDDVLADAAMCSPDAWEGLKADVLAGWDLRDGRWHHAVVGELAAEAATKLRGNASRTAAAREAAARARSKSGDKPDDPAPRKPPLSVTDTVTDTVTGHEERSRIGREEERALSGARTPAHTRELTLNQAMAWPPDAFEQFWQAYPHAVDQEHARRMFQRVELEEAGRLAWADMIAAVHGYAASNTQRREWMNPANWLVKKRWLDRPGTPPGRKSGIGQLIEISDAAVAAEREAQQGGSHAQRDRYPTGGAVTVTRPYSTVRRPDRALDRGAA